MIDRTCRAAVVAACEEKLNGDPDGDDRIRGFILEIAAGLEGATAAVAILNAARELPEAFGEAAMCCLPALFADPQAGGCVIGAFLALGERAASHWPEAARNLTTLASGPKCLHRHQVAQGLDAGLRRGAISVTEELAERLVLWLPPPRTGGRGEARTVTESAPGAALTTMLRLNREVTLRACFHAIEHCDVVGRSQGAAAAAVLAGAGVSEREVLLLVEALLDAAPIADRAAPSQERDDRRAISVALSVLLDCEPIVVSERLLASLTTWPEEWSGALPAEAFTASELPTDARRSWLPAITAFLMDSSKKARSRSDLARAVFVAVRAFPERASSFLQPLAEALAQVAVELEALPIPEAEAAKRECVETMTAKLTALTTLVAPSFPEDALEAFERRLLEPETRPQLRAALFAVAGIVAAGNRGMLTRLIPLFDMALSETPAACVEGALEAAIAVVERSPTVLPADLLQRAAQKLDARVAPEMRRSVARLFASASFPTLAQAEDVFQRLEALIAAAPEEGAPWLSAAGHIARQHVSLASRAAGCFQAAARSSSLLDAAAGLTQLARLADCVPEYQSSYVDALVVACLRHGVRPSLDTHFPGGRPGFPGFPEAFNFLFRWSGAVVRGHAREFEAFGLDGSSPYANFVLAGLLVSFGAYPSARDLLSVVEPWEAADDVVNLSPSGLELTGLLQAFLDLEHNLVNGDTHGAARALAAADYAVDLRRRSWPDRQRRWSALDAKMNIGPPFQHILIGVTQSSEEFYNAWHAMRVRWLALDHLQDEELPNELVSLRELIASLATGHDDSDRALKKMLLAVCDGAISALLWYEGVLNAVEGADRHRSAAEASFGQARSIALSREADRLPAGFSATYAKVVDAVRTLSPGSGLGELVLLISALPFPVPRRDLPRDFRGYDPRQDCAVKAPPALASAGPPRRRVVVRIDPRLGPEPLRSVTVVERGTDYDLRLRVTWRGLRPPAVLRIEVSTTLPRTAYELDLAPVPLEAAAGEHDLRGYLRFHNPQAPGSEPHVLNLSALVECGDGAQAEVTLLGRGRLHFAVRPRGGGAPGDSCPVKLPTPVELSPEEQAEGKLASFANWAPIRISGEKRGRKTNLVYVGDDEVEMPDAYFARFLRLAAGIYESPEGWLSLASLADDPAFEEVTTVSSSLGNIRGPFKGRLRQPDGRPLLAKELIVEKKGLVRLSMHPRLLDWNESALLRDQNPTVRQAASAVIRARENWLRRRLARASE